MFHLPGLVSVIGGKLTTARITAVRVLDRVVKLIGRDPAWSECKTQKVSIGGTNEAVAESLAYWVRRCPKLTSYFRVLYQRYGLDADEICAEVTRIHRALTQRLNRFALRSNMFAGTKWSARSRI